MQPNRIPEAIVAIALIFTFHPTKIAAAPCLSTVPTSNLSPSFCDDGMGIYDVESRALLVEMVAHPTPEVKRLPIDEKMLYRKAYRRVLKATDVQDAPGGGNVVAHMEAGFNFVNAGKETNGWIQIAPTQWIPKDVLGPVNNAVSKFSGVLFDNGLPDRPFGWILFDTKPSKTPGAKPAADAVKVKRYTLVNFFATATVDGWDWYLIAPNQWIQQTHIAYPKPVKRPDGVTGRWFAVDLYEQTLIAYDDDMAVFATLISSGLPKWPTKEGLFKIIDRYTQAKMSGASGLPDNYYLPQVPWIMYFNREEQALHAAYWHDSFGLQRSHGCVNMSMTDANWAFNWTHDQPDAAVYVYRSRPKNDS
ncbi:MAG: L,D-transpeptidase [Chloroflexota bacterium]